ncbi:hypothetical protein [Halorussus sp. AFM4]|uniref:hypothetical protein n=1 Tax=Halorussus sp. AFM4 TaxID=3421651 RepID=UPI003EBF243C
MTLNSETLRLGDELDRLDEQADEYAQLLRDADNDDGEEGESASAAALQQSANEIDQQGRGVAYLAAEYGEDAEVVVAGLDAGEFARVEDRVAAIRAGRTDQSPTPGAHRNVYAAVGLQDAPFLDLEDEADLSQRERVDAKLDAVSALPVGATKWLYDRVDNLSTVSEGNWRRFGERLQETSTD